MPCSRFRDTIRRIALRKAVPVCVALGVGHVFAGGPPPVFWVGSGPPCNFVTLQLAVVAVSDGAIIRVASNQAYADVNLVVSNKSLTIEGGWADCTGTPQAQPILLTGSAAVTEPIIQIHSSGTPRLVTLRRLHLRGGRRSGLEVIGPVSVSVRKSQIDDNQTAGSGGGIQVVGSGINQTSLILHETLIGNIDATPLTGNQASQGGGLACSNASIRLDGVQVRNNVATSAGGGLFLDGCLVSTGGFIHNTPGYGWFHARIDDNEAGINGGGLFAMGGSRVTFGPSPGAAIVVAGNRANWGGGLFLDGTATRMLAGGSTVADNMANQLGGGVFLSDGARLIMRRGEPDPARQPTGGGVISLDSLCQPGTACSQVTGNRADTTNGNAFVVLTKSQLELRHTLVSGNGQGGRNLLVASSQASVVIESSLITGNDSGTADLLRLTDGSTLLLTASTIAGNVSGNVIRLFSDAGANHVELITSIIWQPARRVLRPTEPDVVISTCMNAHEDADIPAATHAPGFVDETTGDYRLRGNSANIDACASPFAVPAIDLHGRIRPFDLDHVPGPGPADRGALELGDTLFADDFEPLSPF